MSRMPKAFTLVELLVVIGLIAILSTVIGLAIGGGGGPSVSSAQRIVVGMTQSSRSQAILKQSRARMIFHDDPSSPELYRRYVGLVYENADTPGVDDWIAANDGVLLPKGAYILLEGTNSSELDDRGPMRIAYPRRQPQEEGQGTGAEDYEFIEFTGQGTLSTSGPVIVIGSGGWEGPYDDENNLVIDEESVAGIMIHKLGSFTTLKDSLDIEKALRAQ